MPDPVDPRELARRLADEAKAKALAKKLAEEAKARVAAAAPVASAPPARKLSALEAMRIAIDAEKAVASAPRPAEVVVAPAPVAPPVAVAPPAPVAAPVVRPVHVDPRAVIERRLPAFDLVEVRPVAQRDTFRALWTAHRVRAATEGDARMLVTADVLLDAASRVAPGALFGARIRRQDKEHALFLDASSGVLLGLTDQPDLYLAGL